MRESFKQSCQRLKTDKIYGLRVHDCETEDRVSELLDKDNGGIWELVKMREENLI